MYQGTSIHHNTSSKFILHPHLWTKGLSINDSGICIYQHTHPPRPLGPWVLPGMHCSFLNDDRAWLVYEMFGTVFESEDDLAANFM